MPQLSAFIPPTVSPFILPPNFNSTFIMTYRAVRGDGRRRPWALFGCSSSRHIADEIGCSVPRSSRASTWRRLHYTCRGSFSMISTKIPWELGATADASVEAFNPIMDGLPILELLWTGASETKTSRKYCDGSLGKSNRGLSYKSFPGHVDFLPLIGDISGDASSRWGAGLILAGWTEWGSLIPGTDISDLKFQASLLQQCVAK